MRMPNTDVADRIFAQAAVVIERREHVRRDAALLQRQIQKRLVAREIALGADGSAQIAPALEHPAYRGRQVKENDTGVIHHLIGGLGAELAHDAGEIEKFCQIVIRRRRHRDAVLFGLGEAQAHIANDFCVGIEIEKRVVAGRQEIDEPRFFEIVGVNKLRLNDRGESGDCPLAYVAPAASVIRTWSASIAAAVRALSMASSMKRSPQENHTIARFIARRVRWRHRGQARSLRQRLAKGASAANVAIRSAGTAKRS